MNNLIINQETFDKVSKILTPKERIIIFKRSGLNGKVATLKELSKELYLSYGNIKQMETEALEKIQRYLDSRLKLNENNQIFNSIIINKNGLLRIVQTKQQREEEIKRMYKKLKK